jgi:hypothetical protein
MVIDNRNRSIDAVFEANERGAGITHVLFLDTDMVFPTDTIDRLLAHQKDFVFASYVRRVAPHFDLTKPKVGDAVIEGDLIEVMGGPLGCSLLDVGLFTEVRRPWFGHDYIAGKDLIAEPDGYAATLYKGFLPEPYHPQSTYSISEDYWFCARVREAGRKIWVDRKLTNELGHVGYRVFTQGDKQS